MTEQPPSAPPRGDPRWVSAAITNTLDELKLYAVTLASVTRSPWRFLPAWADGEQRALNPLAFVATSAAVLGFLMSWVLSLSGRDLGGGLVIQLELALAPYAYYVAVGLLAHLFMVAHARRLTTSAGIALYAGGASAMLGMMGVMLIMLLFLATGHALPQKNPLGGLTGAYHPAAAVFALGGFTLFPAVLTIGLKTTHRVRWPRAALAVIGALLLMGVADHWIPIPTLHLSLHRRSGPIPIPTLQW